jgi:hypothetical protein
MKFMSTKKEGVLRIYVVLLEEMYVCMCSGIHESGAHEVKGESI